ncbi:hypothetical protein J437_LFUL014585 [Ladona fulva]|uniref:non-specific serine/threonine protein kinase n=1 Tax=Ladona fulva TaxID=123851 RepID=A0A8K0NYF5_LADFU|nr:hypothetical protein J437_LFUL014585 [Ladona fulva]
MTTKPDADRRVLAIKAKKKRHKGGMQKGKNVAHGTATPRITNSNDLEERHSSSYSSIIESEDCNYDEEEQEDPKDYRKGGYHPVKIGDLFQNRYRVVRKLGWGHFSTVWLCWDLVDKRFVALKVVKSESHYTETALDEIKLLKRVNNSDVNDPKRQKTVQLLNDFKISGVNGTHVCMVFEVLGENLLKLIIRSNYRGIPIANVKSIIRQVLEGLDYLHTKCRIIHTDIKPENVLLCVDESYVRKLAVEATELYSRGGELPTSLVSTAPKELRDQGIGGKMSRNKKKKLKKKAKQQSELLKIQMQQAEKVEKINIGDKKLDGGDQIPTIDGNKDLAAKELQDQGAWSKLSKNKKKKLKKKAKRQRDMQMKQMQQIKELEEQNLEDKNLEGGDYISIIDSNTDVGDVETETEKKFNGEKDSTESNEACQNGCVKDMISGEEDVSTAGNYRDKGNASCQNGIKIEEVEKHVSGEKDQTDYLRKEELRHDKSRPDPAFDVCSIEVKFADLGNACYVDHHFTEDIQTRQYRALEVILGSPYNTAADIWSTACMAFELATGDYLFEPRPGRDYSRDDDHIACIIKLLGYIPRRIILSGSYSMRFFNKKCELRHIHCPKSCGLEEVLVEKYQWSAKDASDFASFLKPMLDYDTLRRATAAECLEHTWLRDDDLLHIASPTDCPERPCPEDNDPLSRETSVLS